MILRWFKRLLPREDRFFDLFEAHARLGVETAQALENLLAGQDAAHWSEEILRLEHEADVITNDVMMAVRRSFITPFDRSDIQDLIQAMDDAIDMMKKTVKTVRLFGVDSFSPLMREMGEAITEAAELIVEAVQLLDHLDRNVTRLTDIVSQIVRLEKRSDELHEQALRELFERHGHADPMAYMIGAKVYDRLENIMDSLENAADEISGIMVENV